ncbi:hypothetical protein ACYZUE_19855, partial [Xanthomonas campestris pv. campestris]
MQATTCCARADNGRSARWISQSVSTTGCSPSTTWIAAWSWKARRAPHYGQRVQSGFRAVIKTTAQPPGGRGRCSESA